MSDDGRFLGREALLAAGITFVVWFLAGIVIGLVTLVDSLVVLDLAIVLGSVIPTGVGAWFGARRVARQIGSGLPAAAVGLSGALMVIIVFAVLGNVGSEEAALMPTVVWPLLGALAGAWFGGIQHLRSRSG